MKSLTFFFFRQTVFISATSVNSRKREGSSGYIAPNASFNPAEKKLYAFAEKTQSVPLGAAATAKPQINLRRVTRLDPLTYLLFGAYKLRVTNSGLEADRWLPVAGSLHALDDLQRLKTLLDTCMLRVFEGLGHSLTRARDARRNQARDAIKVSRGSSRFADDETQDTGDADERENESDDDEEESQDAVAPVAKKVYPLSRDEILELEMLTTDVVRILDAYAQERDGINGSRRSSRAPTPGSMTPRFGSGMDMSRNSSDQGYQRRRRDPTRTTTSTRRSWG